MDHQLLSHPCPSRLPLTRESLSLLRYPRAATHAGTSQMVFCSWAHTQLRASASPSSRVLWARWARARHPGHQQTTVHFQVLRTPVVHFNNRCSAPVPGPRELPLRSCSSLSLLLCCVQPTSHFRPPSPGFCESTLVPPACSAFFSLRHRVWYESRSFPLFFQPGIQSNKKVASLDHFRRVRSSAFNSATQVHQSTTLATFHAFPRDCAIVPSASLTDCPSLDKHWTKKLVNQ